MIAIPRARDRKKYARIIGIGMLAILFWLVILNSISATLKPKELKFCISFCENKSKASEFYKYLKTNEILECWCKEPIIFITKIKNYSGT